MVINKKHVFMRKAIVLPILLALLLSSGRAQENPLQFTVEVSTDSLLMGHTLRVAFTLENAQGEAFEAPYFNGFDVLSGPNYASRVTMVNGQTTQSISYTFLLRPKEAGNFYIEPASISVEGQVLETMPMEVIVVPNPDGIPQEAPQHRLGNSEMFPNMPRSDFFDGGFPDSPFNWEELEFPGFDLEEFRQLLPDEAPQAPKQKKKRKTYKL